MTEITDWGTWAEMRRRLRISPRVALSLDAIRADEMTVPDCMVITWSGAPENTARVAALEVMVLTAAQVPAS